LIAIIWLIVGIYAGPVIYIVVPIMLIMLFKKEMHLEILLGFFLILTLSDSRLNQLAFAASVKNIYILFISFICFKHMSEIKNPIVIFKYFIPFYLVALICVFFNPNIALSFQKTLSYILLFVFVPNYFLMVYNRYGNVLLKSFVFFVTLILILGLILNLFSSDITILAGRYRGLLGNPNGLGLYVFLFIVFFAIINEYFPETFSRNEKWIVYSISLFSLIKCGARASLISVLLFFFFKKFYKISPILGFVIFLVVLFTYQLVSENLTEIIISLGLGERFRVETLETGSGRVIAWKFAWEQIQENYFIGKGFSYTDHLYHKYYEFLSRLGHEGSAHNSYLTLWLDTGLVGLVFFLMGLLISFYKMLKSSRLAIPMLYAILFSNYYESWITASLNPFTIQFIFSMCVIFIHANNTQKSDI